MIVGTRVWSAPSSSAKPKESTTPPVLIDEREPKNRGIPRHAPVFIIEYTPRSVSQGLVGLQVHLPLRVSLVNCSKNVRLNESVV